MKNVLHLTLSLAPGGRREVILYLADQMKCLGHEAWLGVLGTPAPSDPVFETAVALIRRSLLDRKALARLAEFCERQRVDVIHTHDAASQFLAALLRVRHPCTAPRALMTFHRSVAIESASWRDRLRNRFACAMTGAVVAVSEERRRHFLDENRVNPRKVVCIPNGIDVERYRSDAATRTAVRRELGVSNDTVVLGAVGHFGREKGLDLVLASFRELLTLAGSADLRLVVAGQGAEHERSKLEQIAAECGGRVSFLGQRNDMARWYQALDLLLHAPREEAFGLVLVEAMAAGVPVVATRVGGIPEIVRDGETGRLVEPESPSALAMAALQLLESPDLRRQWGHRGAEVANDEFSVKLQTQRYLSVYDELLAGRLPAAANHIPPISSTESPKRSNLQPMTA